MRKKETHHDEHRDRPKVQVGGLGLGDLEETVRAVAGIFGALNQIVTHQMAGEIDDVKVRNHADQLILAGQLITSEVSERF